MILLKHITATVLVLCSIGFSGNDLFAESNDNGHDHSYSDNIFALEIDGSDGPQPPTASVPDSAFVPDDTICPGKSMVLKVINSEPNLSYYIYDITNSQSISTPIYGNGDTLALLSFPLVNSFDCQLYVTDSAGTSLAIYPEVFSILLTPNPNDLLDPSYSLCDNDSLILDPIGNHNSYVWSTSATTPTITVYSAGLYRVEVTDIYGCVGSDSTTIEILPAPKFEMVDNFICPGDSIDLTFKNGCLDCDNYLWSTGATTPSINVSTSGQYSLLVTNVLGCRDSATSNITQVGNLDLLPSDTTICNGESVTLTSQYAGSSYQWNTGAIGQSINVQQAGTYVLTLDSFTCSFVDSVQVLTESAPMLDLGADQDICEGENALLVVQTNAATYAWQNGVSDSTYLTSQGGIFWVEAASQHGCISRDSVEVVEHSNPDVLLAGLLGEYCISEEPIPFVAAPAGGQYLSGNVSGNELDPSQFSPGRHTIVYEFTDGFGCSDTAHQEIEIFAEPDAPNAGPDQSLSMEGEITLNANTLLVGQGMWTVSPSGPYILEGSSPQTTVQNLNSGQYVFTWTATNGTCPAKSDEMVVLVKPFALPSGFSPNGDGVNETLVFRGIEDCEIRSISVFNRWGNEVYSSAQYNNDWDGGELADDTYYYTLNLGNKGTFKNYVVVRR